MRRLALFGILSLAVAGGLAAAPGDAEAAAARKGSCLLPGSTATCTVWTGRVTFVDDGDTLRVDLDRDGTRNAIKVRMTGIQAMEQTVYTRNVARRRGECHALAATARLERLIKRGRGRVRLSAQDPSSRSAGRWRRSIAVKLGGRWHDVGRRLVAEGHALWLPNRKEWLWNRDYSVLAERAALAKRGLWNTHSCGHGPHDTAPLSLWANADADGDDNDFVNGEWVKVRNNSPVEEVALGGWWIRDSALRRFTFPSYATLAPGETLTLYAGEGPDSWTEFFWNQRRPVFENPTNDENAIGDGAYLFDPQGDLRAWMTYPCRENCAHPYQGMLELTAEYKGRERVEVRNVGAAAVDLYGLRLQTAPYSYPFPPDSVLAPGEELEIVVTGDPSEDTRLEKNWGETGPILNNGGDRIRLTTFRDVVLACYAYGSRSC
jgi:endonuclease YncB( thermonuclease family)